MLIENATINIQVKYFKDMAVSTGYDTKLEIEQEISKLLFSLFRQGKVVDFRIIDDDLIGIDDVTYDTKGEKQ